jgi:hypothetical protein
MPHLGHSGSVKPQLLSDPILVRVMSELLKFAARPIFKFLSDNRPVEQRNLHERVCYEDHIHMLSLS